MTQLNGISHLKTQDGKKRRIAPNGMRKKLVAKYLSSHPNATSTEVAKALNIKIHWASKLIRQIRRDNQNLLYEPDIARFVEDAHHDAIAKGSAVDKIVKALNSKSNEEATPKNKPEVRHKTKYEQKLLALISLLGIERVQKILNDERKRIMKMIRGIDE